MSRFPLKLPYYNVIFTLSVIVHHGHINKGHLKREFPFIEFIITLANTLIIPMSLADRSRQETTQQ